MTDWLPSACSVNIYGDKHDCYKTASVKLKCRFDQTNKVTAGSLDNIRVVILFMVFIPGFPLPQVITLSSLLIFRNQPLKSRVSAAAETDKDKEEEPVSEEEYFRNIDNIYELIQIDPIAMEVGYSLIPLVDVDGGNFIDRVVMFRRQFAQDMGMVVPSVRLRDNGYLNPNEYVIKVKGEEVAKGEILVEYYLALDPGNLTGEVDGIETIEPAYGIPSKWIKKDKKELAEIYGYTVIDPLSVLITHLSEVVKTHAHELLSRQDLNQLLDKIKKDNKLLVEELFPESYLRAICKYWAICLKKAFLLKIWKQF